VSRLAVRLGSLADDGRKALVTFITAGDPHLTATVPALHALVTGGADVLELGVPFSDPEAEGPAIQASSERGLAQGTTLRRVLEMVAEFRTRDQDTPVVLMGYLNSVLAMGPRVFAQAAAEVGVDGLIMVNLPPEEAVEIRELLATHGIDLIFLVAPTTTHDRARMIAGQAAGFVYYVSLKGITGADHLQVDSVADYVTWLKTVAPLPVMVGFGIKDPQSARAVAEYADGVVVGSVLVNTMGAHAEQLSEISPRLTEQVQAFRAALDAG
jgi:tryptophan synthase alpha chain